MQSLPYNIVKVRQTLETQEQDSMRSDPYVVLDNLMRNLGKLLETFAGFSPSSLQISFESAKAFPLLVCCNLAPAVFPAVFFAYHSKAKNGDAWLQGSTDEKYSPSQPGWYIDNFRSSWGGFSEIVWRWYFFGKSAEQMYEYIRPESRISADKSLHERWQQLGS